MTCPSGQTSIEGKCYADECLIGNIICSSHGECQNDSQSCRCAVNFTGLKCNECSAGLIPVNNNTECVNQNCVINDTICSGNGICGGVNKNICRCNTGFTEYYCQCATGTRLIPNSQQCAVDLCKSNKGECYGRSNCILNVQAQEFVCNGCGIYTKNDPRQACRECITGAAFVNPQSDRICVDTACIIGGIECNNKGKCNSEGKCTCEGNFDPTSVCTTCITDFTLHNGKCIHNICKTGDTECNNRGNCDYTTFECRCVPGFSGSSCELCADGLVFANNNTECVSPDCVRGDKICSDNGYCGESSGYKCQCENGTSGKVCQCKEGYSELYYNDFNCGLDLCKSPIGSCYHRGTCIIEGVQLVCGDCGDYIYNDPRKGCYECKSGSTYYGHIDNRDCRPEKCITGDSLCSGHGTCLNTGICKCIDQHSDPNTGCSNCLPAFQLINNNCVHQNCVYNGTECDRNGTCDGEQCVCQTNLLDDRKKCSACKSENALINELCTICKAGYEIVHGQCIDVNCPKGEVFNPSILGCEPIEQNQKGNSTGLIVGIVVMVLIVLGLAAFGIYFYFKKRSQIPRRNSIVMPSREVGMPQIKGNSSAGLINETQLYAK
ncbi:Tenascin-like protein [Spironucleus salmonicida]|uniref:Tenascin n=1 Tax=Spironucleus salmonicida TaxID=348837 RepID=V6LT57_9EUKA|nr:Tenascin-like protein [Spironucleus salmonicida]|eukprot:EST47760.1 Tenascin [Spironucleus salmonicida]